MIKIFRKGSDDDKESSKDKIVEMDSALEELKNKYLRLMMVYLLEKNFLRPNEGEEILYYAWGDVYSEGSKSKNEPIILTNQKIVLRMEDGFIFIPFSNVGKVQSKTITDEDGYSMTEISINNGMVVIEVYGDTGSTLAMLIGKYALKYSPNSNNQELNEERID